MADISGFVEPTGSIKLYSNVKWDATHQNAFYFTTQAQLDTYLASGLVAEYSRNSYVRVENGVLKVRDVEGRLVTANYLSFNNGSALNSKTYYAFVDYTEYDNNNCTIVHYSIDYLTTYWLDMSFDACYITRTHEKTDKAGENIVPEPINISSQVVTDTGTGDLSDNYGVIIASIRATDGTTGSPYVFYRDRVVNSSGMCKGMYNGLYMYLFLSTDVEAGLASTCIHTILNSDSDASPTDIVYVLIAPNVVIRNAYSTGFSTWTHNLTMPTVLGNANKKYTPKNKKLFTYPFTYFTLTSGNATTKYLFEDFDARPQPGDKVVFKSLGGSPYPDSSITTYPLNYDGFADDYVDSVTGNNFPLALWSNESNNHTRENVSSVLGGLAGLGQVVAGVATSQPFMIGQGIAGVANNVTQAVMTNTKETVGSGGSSKGYQSLLCFGNRIFFRIISPSYEDCKRIDEFFTMYGYAVERYEVPDFNARPYYTFIQCTHVNVKGLMPEKARQEVIRILRQGCTFWNNASNIGNYNLDNRAS